MGLDCYIYEVPADFVRNVPWVDGELPDHGCKAVAYWRKNWEIQNYFHQIYKNLQGKDPNFNCTYLRIWKHNLDTSGIPDLVAFSKNADWINYAYFYHAWY